MRRHESFEWDRNKSRQNAQKHGVSFELAAFVLADTDADRFHIEVFDLDHSVEEERWLTIGSVPTDRTIVLTVHGAIGRGVTRMISARRATPGERRMYEQTLGG